MKIDEFEDWEKDLDELEKELKIPRLDEDLELPEIKWGEILDIEWGNK